MKERKRKLRKLIAEKKATHSHSTLEALSADVLKLLENHPVFQKAETVLLYFSMKDEVHTHSFIEKWSRYKRILLPVVMDNELELRFYSGPEQLISNSYGIKEPAGDPFDDYTSIDLAVIPGVAFDAKGCRLGRGKGYYDRLLPKITAPKIGICFPFQVVEEIPTEEFDVLMDGIITGNREIGTTIFYEND